MSKRGWAVAGGGFLAALLAAGLAAFGVAGWLVLQVLTDLP